MIKKMWKRSCTQRRYEIALHRHGNYLCVESEASTELLITTAVILFGIGKNGNSD